MLVKLFHKGVWFNMVREQRKRSTKVSIDLCKCVKTVLNFAFVCMCVCVCVCVFCVCVADLLQILPVTFYDHLNVSFSSFSLSALM